MLFMIMLMLKIRNENAHTFFRSELTANITPLDPVVFLDGFPRVQMPGGSHARSLQKGQTGLLLHRETVPIGSCVTNVLNTQSADVFYLP